MLKELILKFMAKFQGQSFCTLGTMNHLFTKLNQFILYYLGLAPKPAGVAKCMNEVSIKVQNTFMEWQDNTVQ